MAAVGGHYGSTQGLDRGESRHSAHSVDVRDKACLGRLFTLPCTLGVRPFSVTWPITFLNLLFPMVWMNRNILRQTGLPWWWRSVYTFSRSASLWRATTDTVELVFIPASNCPMTAMSSSALESSKQDALTEVRYSSVNWPLHCLPLAFFQPHPDDRKLTVASLSISSVGRLMTTSSVMVCSDAIVAFTLSSVFTTPQSSSSSLSTASLCSIESVRS